MPAASVLELRQMVRQCVGDVLAEQYARKNAPGQRSLFGGEKLASDKTQGQFRWVTIGGESGEKGEHEGGTPIKIEKATGAIVAGPKALAEKGIKKVSDFGKSESERQQQGSKGDDSDSGAAKAGPGVDEKRQPAGAVGADESTERTPPAKTHDPYAAALSEVKGVVESADMGTAAGEFEAMKKVVDISKKHGVNANELWREATWSANHRDIEAEVSGEADERAAERGSGLQSGDWDAKLKALQKRIGKAVPNVKVTSDSSPLTSEKLFERTGQGFENLQIAMGIKKPAKGEKGAQNIRDFVSSHPGGRVIAAVLNVDGSQSGYDRNGFADRGQDSYRDAIDGKFTKPELDAAAKWLEDTYNNSKGDLANVNQYRWIAGTIKTSQPTAAANQQDAEVGTPASSGQAGASASRESVVKDIAEKVAEKLGVDTRPSEAAYDRARHATAATKDVPDTAQVNVPLGKRGDIDKQIDQLKENDRRDAKERARESAKIRDEAKALFGTHGDALALSTIQKNGGTLKEAKAAMKDIIASNPALAKKMLEDFAAKSSSSEPKPEAPQEPSPAVPKGLEGLPPHSGARIQEMRRRINEGEASADDVRAYWADMQTPEFQKGVRDELSKLTIQQLKKSGARGWYNREKKADLAEQLAQSWLNGEMFAKLDGGGVRIGVTGVSDFANAQRNAVNSQIAGLTDEHIRQHVAGLANQRKAYQERVAAAEAGMENPQTLEDFERLNRQADGDESKMKPEHLEAFDDLRARARRATAEARKAAVTVSHEATKTFSGFDLSKNFHSKRGHDIFTASPQNRVGRDEFKATEAAAKKLGGWYYQAWGGTPGGFHFPTESARDEFLKVMGGGKGDASETQAARTEQKQQTAAESLREKADAIHSAASEELGRDRQTNTARRADMAASIEARARGQQAKAETMKRLADRLEKGELQHLAGVRAGTHLDTLDSMMREARYKSLNANRDKMGGRRYEDALSEPASRDDIAHAEFPYPKLYHSDLLKYSSELADVPGLKNIAASLRKKVDEGFQKEGKGGVKFSGGQFVTPDQTRLNGIPEGKAVRVHRSKDRRLAGDLQKHGLDHAYTADLGKTFAKTPDEAIAAAGMRGHALDLVDAKKATSEQVTFTDPADIAKLQTIASRLKNSSDRGKQLIADNLNWKMEHIKRLHAMDITNAPELRAALREYHSLKAEKQAEDPIKAAERKLVGRRIDGFFPTPKTLANRVIDEADIRPGMKVLEPSAGKGDLLDAIRSRHGDEVTSHAIEPVHDLREVLGAKGHELVGHDFLSHKEGGYDRIVMNPPFENHQDIEHVKHAYSLLAPGGKVVAIMSNGGGSKRQAFDDWLSEQGGSSEDLPEGSFNSNEAFRKTGVNTRLVTIEKASGESQKPDQYSRRDLQDMVRYAIGNAVKERYSEARGPMSQDMLRNYGKSLRDRIASAASQTDRNPTDEQKKAGNYRKGKFWLWGHEVAIENPKGSTRSGKDASGKAWSVTMGAHYGYVRRTVSKADGDAVDCFIGPHPESEVVFVVNQRKPSGRFDEHKCVIGCRSIGEAKNLYLSCYSAGWQGMQSIVPMTKPQFLTWLERGDTTRAVKFNDSIERYDRSSDLAAKLERMGLKPTSGMVSAFEKAYERRKLKDMGQEIPEHHKHASPDDEPFDKFSRRAALSIMGKLA